MTASEIEAVKRLVSAKEIRAVQGRTKPGQEQWFRETEEAWMKLRQED